MDHHPLSGLSILGVEDETLLRKQVAAARQITWSSRLIPPSWGWC
jgi:hypothetical protein